MLKSEARVGELEAKAFCVARSDERTEQEQIRWEQHLEGGLEGQDQMPESKVMLEGQSRGARVGGLKRRLPISQDGRKTQSKNRYSWHKNRRLGSEAGMACQHWRPESGARVGG